MVGGLRLFLMRAAGVAKFAMVAVILCLLLATFRAAVSPAAAQPTPAAQWMIGLWYGEGYQPKFNRRDQWLVERYADGAFSVEFRHYDDCKLIYSSVQTGTWTADSVNYVSHTSVIDGRPVNFLSRYRITRHTDQEMDYFWIEGNVPFHSTKVDAAFKVPGCPTS